MTNKYLKYYVLIDVPALETERLDRNETIRKFASYLDISEPTYHLIKKEGYTTVNTGGKIKEVLPHVIGRMMNTSELDQYLRQNGESTSPSPDTSITVVEDGNSDQVREDDTSS